MTITPFLHYGMYSAKFSIPDSIEVWEFIVNGRRLNFADMSAKNTDNIIEPVRIYDLNNRQGGASINDISRILSRVRVPYKNASFNTDLALEAFGNWYKKRLSHILEENVSRIEIQQAVYLVKGSSLQKLQARTVYAIN